MNTVKDPVFLEIAQNLIEMLESGHSKGKYVGHSFKNGVSQEVRDASAAIRILGIIGDNSKNAVNILTKFLEKETHWWLPSLSAKSLGAIGNDAESAIPLLAALMLPDGNEPKSDWGHYAAASAMGKIGSKKAVPYLIQAINDPNEQGPCYGAISSLGKLGENARPAISVLVKIMHDEKFSSYISAIIHALGEIGPPDGIGWKAIKDFLLKTEDEELRVISVESLYHMLFTSGSPVKNVNKFFAKLRKDENKEVVEWATHALKRLESIL